jgi:hypothetical protein
MEGEMTTLDPETTRLLRTILDELCASIPPADVSTKTNVASRLLEAVGDGRSPSIDHLKAVGKEALLRTPTMWR